MAILDRCSSAFLVARRTALAFASAVLLLGSPGHVLAVGAPAAASDSQPALKTIVIPVQGMACVTALAKINMTHDSTTSAFSEVELSIPSMVCDGCEEKIRQARTKEDMKGRMIDALVTTRAALTMIALLA